jgi:hypothetical protein
MPLPRAPNPLGFLPPSQWSSAQAFNTVMAGTKMEYYTRCREYWFEIGLKDRVCHLCALRDKGHKTLFLMSRDNGIDLGNIPAYLPNLSQLEEMIIARSHV